MTQEEKSIVFKDLCARLPYGFIILRCSDKCIIVIESNDIDKFAHFLKYSEGEDFKPYLRPMSSMTVEEMKTFPYPYYFDWIDIDRKIMCSNNECSPCLDFDEINDVTDWLNKHHLDYRGLIGKGLALEASEGMYNIKEK